jgi:hypothetical protein
MYRRTAVAAESKLDQSPTSPKASKSQDDDKGHQAAGLIASRQVLALGPLLKKCKTDDKDIGEFQAKVAAGQKTLDAVIEQRLRQA